jgi:hypothetical protein
LWHNTHHTGIEGREIKPESAYLMLLQTNSYVVPKEKRAEHARLMRRFRQVLNRLGCDSFEVYEQVGANWTNTQTSGRFVQIMRFRDRKHQLAVQTAERNDPGAQELIAEFVELVNYPLQQQQGQFAVGFYTSVLPISLVRVPQHPADADTADTATAHDEPLPDDPTHPPIDPDAAAFGSALVTTETLGAAADDLSAPPLSEAEAEAAADDFAAHAEQAEANLAEHTESHAEESTPAAEHAPAEDDTPLPTLESEPAVDHASDEPTAPATPNEHPATSDEPAHAPSDKNGEFDLDDLDAAEGDFEITDDDLARLAQELSDHPQGNPNKGPDSRGSR